MDKLPTNARLLALVLVVGWATTAGAQTVTYLAPAKHQANVGDHAIIRFEEGQADAVRQASWPSDEMKLLLVRAGPEQNNYQTIKPARAGEQSISVPLKRRTFQLPFFFVELEAFGDRLAFAPDLPELWFQVERGEASGCRRRRRWAGSAENVRRRRERFSSRRPSRGSERSSGHG